MSSMFIRVYGSVLLAIALIYGAGQLAMMLTETTRSHYYWQQRFSPLWLELLPSPFSPLSSSSQTSTDVADAYDSVYGQAQSVGKLSWQWLSPEALGAFKQYQLDHRGVAVAPSAEALEVWLADPTVAPDRVLHIRMASPQGHHWPALVDSLQALVQKYPQRADALVQWLPELVGDDVRIAISDHGTLERFRIALPDGRYIGLTPELGYWRLQATLVILLFAALLLGVVMYQLVNQLEGGLKNLDQVTGRLAQGHLSARVSVAGHDAVSGLGCSINKMADHIQRLIGIQREMLRAVSHELRTPVARLRFGLQIMEDDASDPVLGKQLRGMDDDLQELDQLIDEILTYARLEEGGPLLEFQLVDVQDIAWQVVDETNPSARVNVLFIESGARDTRGEVEPRYIHRAIQNLVGNACRYASSEVNVLCSFTEDTCRVDVEDDGPGIPEDQWGSVFEAFARLDDSRTRSSGGYGLGLSIVRRITYWHGGRAIVGRSDSLGGARFSLVWPRRHTE
ncbi:ATP-binding protein [Oceanobacter kriegii]|uniref:ATP-binding protein n=1 Tax=Oceanobacter kriegii TaxID=64972 RepID=UPI000425F6CE|nr:ATP-binding protein [Oceanobacter kriegii]